MKPSSAYQISQTFALLLVGEPKSGKSNIALAFPDPWILDLDHNLSSAVRRAPGKKFFFDNLDGVEPLKYQETLEAKIKEASANPEVKTLVIDSTTSLAAAVREGILANLRAHGAKLRADTLDDQLRISDYQTIMTYVLRLLALCRASGKFVIWTAHQKADRDELTGTIRYQLNIPGQLKDSFGAYFTDVWAAVASQTLTATGPGAKYTIRTKPTGLHYSLGASFDIAAENDVTNKTPSDVWSLLSPKMGAK